METTVKQRLIYFIKSKGFSQGRFEKEVGLSNGFVNNISKGIGADKLQRILRSFPDLNQSWLLNGEGEMLLPINEMSNNKINASGNSNVSAVYNNRQSINISLPESGTQKIIKPDGSMEIQSLSSSASSGLNDTDRLNQRIQDLERIILEKDATIKSKDETIWALRTMLDRQ